MLCTFEKYDVEDFAVDFADAGTFTQINWRVLSAPLVSAH